MILYIFILTYLQIKEYVKEFHKDIIGLTGSYDEIKKVCKDFRVYFSTPTDVKPGDDYIVDHSIFFYLMDPNMEFVDVFGRQMTADEMAVKLEGYLKGSK